MDDLKRLRRRYERERLARKEAEGLLEAKSRELYAANLELRRAHEELERRVVQRTLELEAANQRLRQEVQVRRLAQAELEIAKQAADLAREEAETANKAKSLFLANISHELRTPLNAIIGYSEMLAEEYGAAMDVTFGQDIGAVVTAGHHLLALINNILDLSKIEAGKMELFPEEFAVAEIVQAVIATIHPLMDENNNQFVTDFGEDVGMMVADQLKVRQILLNLLSNAAKFTQNGAITLRIRREQNSPLSQLHSPTDRSRSYLIFQVTDTGMGMSVSQSEGIFDLFMQADSSIANRHGGTGLGLALARQFCHLMGGEITVESALGTGSRFTVELPATPI